MDQIDQKQLFKQVGRIHNDVFRAFQYTPDLEKYGKLEDWRLPDNFKHITDDCDGFALAARYYCDEAGLESRLIICEVGGDGHLVCGVGNYIIDNRFRMVKTKDFLEKVGGYKWIAVSGLNRGDDWHLVA